MSKIEKERNTSAILRYNGVFHGKNNKVDEIIEQKTTVFGKYCVDDSNFQPISEALKTLNGRRPLTDPEIQAHFDFADGKDDGRDAPLERRYNDITELSTDIRKKQGEIKDKIDEARYYAKKMQKLNGNEAN